MTNIVLLVGNLGGDPELRSTNGGTDVTTFSLGTSRPRRDSEGKTYKDESGFTAKDTEWHRVTCFNGLGRVVAQHATKGMLVSVKGRIHNSKWTDKDGVDRYGYEIIADDVQFLARSKAQPRRPRRPRRPARTTTCRSDRPSQPRRFAAGGLFFLFAGEVVGRGSCRVRPSVADGGAALKDARFPNLLRKSAPPGQARL